MTPNTQEKLLIFASQLPLFENAFMQQMVTEENTEILDAVEKFHNEKIASNQLQEILVSIVLHYQIKYCHQIWIDVFSKISTDQAKLLVKSSDEVKQNKTNVSLVYGEIDFFSFASILQKANPRQGELFFDLGHGTGRAIIATHLLYGHCFDKIHGIEIISALNSVSTEITSAYLDRIKSSPEIFSQHVCPIDTRLGDLTDDSNDAFDWINADVVFANSTCFSDSLMDALSRKAVALKPGSRLITFTKPLSTLDAFEIVDSRRYCMSWGEATSFIHRRKPWSTVTTATTEA